MKSLNMRRHSAIIAVSLIILGTIGILTAVQILHSPEEPNLLLESLRVKYATISDAATDHSEYKALQKNFKSPQEVTQTCITCHTKRHTEVMESAHWNWDRISYIEGRGIHAIGKKNVLNNYCIGVAGNEMACASCHTGFGMTDFKEFDFNEPKNVDCLSCHASGEDYFKGTSMAGLPAISVNLKEAAQSVGKSSIENCGSCHFYGGGGNNVKHGDLEEALYTATREIDVHLAQDGIKMTCTDCHTAENHEIKGRLYSVSSSNENRALCQDCHTQKPHLTEVLNTHSARVACQTCHIPVYAKVNPTKMSWKWSDAGNLKDGKPFVLDDDQGEHAYMSQKGTFVWEKNVTPEYVWFNGTADHYLLGDKIDPKNPPVLINELLGSANDSESQIIPVKVHRGDQIYDKNYLTLIQPNLFSDAPQDSAFWKYFDWHKAAADGMANIGLPYSGEHDFVETEMFWPINHMVSPAAQSLQCVDCHTRENGRLASLTDFYLPGRDRSDVIDGMGGWMMLLAILGVVVHSGFRIATFIKTKNDLEMQDYREFDDGQN